MEIFFTADTHFCHGKSFLYEPRGFTNVNEMNETIVERWNSVVKPEDEVYHLGDFALNGEWNLQGEQQGEQHLNGGQWRLHLQGQQRHKLQHLQGKLWHIVQQRHGL